MIACTFNPANTYVSGWLGINMIVVLVGFAITAFVYAAARFMPTSARERISGISKSEITQLMLSVLILFTVLAFSSIAYSISCNVAQSLVSSGGSTIPFSNPFQFASQYISNMSMGVGLNLYSNVLSQSYQFSMVSGIYEALPELICDVFETVGVGTTAHSVSSFICKPTLLSSPLLNVGFSWGADIYIIYDILGYLYLAIFGPLIIIGVITLFIQYLAIPVIQYLAFGVALPVALVMRSIPFGGNGLRSTSNLILALAVALYIIYPLTIAFDAWAVHQIFTQATNPLYSFISSMPGINVAAPNNYFKDLNPSSTDSFLGYTIPAVGAAFNTFFSSSQITSYIPLVNIAGIVQQTISVTAQIARYMFESIFLFGINLAITLGFASSLSKALTMGVEGNAGFWANL